MFDKKNYVLNCDICDARKMKEEDYNNYKNMIINADIVIVSTSSKSILNRASDNSACNSFSLL